MLCLLCCAVLLCVVRCVCREERRGRLCAMCCVVCYVMFCCVVLRSVCVVLCCIVLCLCYYVMIDVRSERKRRERREEREEGGEEKRRGRSGECLLKTRTPHLGCGEKILEKQLIYRYIYICERNLYVFVCVSPFARSSEVYKQM